MTLRDVNQSMHLSFYRTAGLAAAITFLVEGHSLAAPSDDFYRNLLRRGISQVEAGDFQGGAKLLRIAAFGLVDSLDEFETAHIYLVIAHDGLKKDADARHSAQRVVYAERVARRYPSLPISAPIRNRFETIAARLLTPDQTAVLRGGPLPQPTTPPSLVVRRDPSPPPAATNGGPMPAPPTTPPVVTRTTSPSPATPLPQSTSVQPSPQPAQTVPQPQPAPRTPAPAPAPVTIIPPAAKPVPQPPPLPQVIPRVVNVDAELDRAESALTANDLETARQIFSPLLARSTLSHQQRIRIAEGLTRGRDFESAVRAFKRVGVFRKGEESYRYYYAIVLYETGDYRAAKREMDAALPFIEPTPDVERYRIRIEGAAN